MTLPIPSPLSKFSIDSTDKFAIAYYREGTQDYADVVIHFNGMVQVSKYRVSIAQDRMSVLWQCSV